MFNHPQNHWYAPDLDEKAINRLQEIASELDDLLPVPTQVINPEELTRDQAEMVRIYVRRALMFQLLHQEFHMHELDDCGDYLTAATDNWSSLFTNLFNNDFQNEVEETKKFLTDFEAYPIGGCDGEIRHNLLPDGWEGYDDDPAS